MSFKFRCPYCDAPLRLANALTKKSRLTCPKCDTMFHIDVQAVTANGRVEKPRPRRRGLRVSEEGMPTGPPPAKPISRLVVWGGTATATIAVLLVSAVFKILRVPVDDLHLLPGICAAFAFAGHFTASLADERKLMHCIYAAVTSIVAYLLFFVIGFLHDDQSIQIADHLLDALREVGPIYAALFVSFMIGGLSERTLTWFVRAVGRRRRWHYVTESGKRIRAQGPWRHPILAFFWRLVGLGFFLTCWTPFLLYPHESGNRDVAACFLSLGWTCWILARKRTARDAYVALEGEFDPPIVYLRSFRHDGRRVGEGILHDYIGMLDPLDMLWTPTTEQQLAGIMSDFGPFVAIGKPGEELPEFGAARMYVEDNDWQAVVGDLLSQDGSVALLQAGETQGLRWELHRIGQILEPEQVLLFVPFGLWASPRTREKLYTAFRSWAEECLGTRLPRKLGHSCFIYFKSDPAWQAYTLEKNDEIPEEHDLADILEEIQDNDALWPRRAILEGKLLRVLLVILVVLLGCTAYVAISGVPWDHAGPVPVQPKLKAPVDKAKAGAPRP